MSVECRYCAHLVPPEDWSPVPWHCRFALQVQDVPHECPQFEREPGSDDDLEDLADG